LPLVIRWFKLGHARETEEEEEYAREAFARHEAMEAALRQIEEEAGARAYRTRRSPWRARVTRPAASSFRRVSRKAGRRRARRPRGHGPDHGRARVIYQAGGRRAGKINDETRRKIERELDLRRR